MIVVINGIVVTLQTDLPTLEWSELESQLLVELVLLCIVKTTVLHLKNLITMNRVSVWIVNRVSRPTTGNIMEEESCHVRRTAVVLTYPLRIIGNCEPIFQVGSNLTREVVTCEFVLSMTDKTTLVEDSTAKVIVHLATATTEGNIMLGGRNI